MDKRVGENREELTLGELWERFEQWSMFLLRRWWILALAGIMGGIAGIVYAWMQPPKYQARTTFALEESGGGMSGALSLAAEFGFALGGAGNHVFAGDNILMILTSRRIVEGVLLSADTLNGKATTLADWYLSVTEQEKNFTNHPRLGTVRFPVRQKREQFTYAQDSVLHTMYLQITKGALVASKPERKFNVFEVVFTSPDERFSKVFTERLLAESDSFYTALRTERSLRTLSVLEKQVAGMKGSVGSALSGRAAVEDANLNPAFARQGAILQQKQVDVSAYGAAYVELFKNLEMARYQYLNDKPLLQIIDKPTYPMLNLKKGRLFTGVVFGLIFSVITVIVLTLLGLVRGFKRRV